ncbi:hypothetical protein OEZ85_012396 [Tetradesmus obliquus]|uniref:Uncharacterized protein n=1 Tax=Tetradesmus obliquus TaxID=3088 RepID=A0ABY8TTC4_TETOB|nr:hypothetical protein OEZ85_012396 [Tetradesmus obliquus]
MSGNHYSKHTQLTAQHIQDHTAAASSPTQLHRLSCKHWKQRSSCNLSYLLVNLETMQHAKYPEGYWFPVEQSLRLTEDQKAALKLCWEHSDGSRRGGPGASGSSSPSRAEEVLLSVYSKEQQHIEQQLAIITGKIKLLFFCQELQWCNVLTYKQIAEAHVNAYPFVPDALSACEALDEVGWQ